MSDSNYLLRNLEIGDVVLTNNVNPYSRIKSVAQKKFTGGSFTHVMMCVAYETLVESVGGGVRFISSRELAFSNKNNLSILRLKHKFEFPNLFTEGLHDYAFMQYNNEGITSFIGIGESNPNKVFCSELVAKVYSDYGIELFDILPSKVTPKSFEESDKFENVTDSCIYIIDRLPNYISRIYDKGIQIKNTVLEIQEKSIANMNEKLVKKYKEIPNLQFAYELLGNYHHLKNKGIYKILLSQVENDDDSFIKSINNLSVQKVYKVITNLIKNYKLKNLEDLDIFIIKFDKDFDQICSKGNYYSSYKNYKNAYQNFKSLKDNDLLNVGNKEKEYLLKSLSQELVTYLMIYKRNEEQLNIMTKNSENMKFQVIKKSQYSLKIINFEFKKIISLFQKNISLVEKYIT